MLDVVALVRKMWELKMAFVTMFGENGSSFPVIFSSTFISD